ncbi:hypothetical protein CHCC20375_3890 [Bacillus licheniformis]|nr:hypothetical protein [Bacillus haynesii]TWK13535.1 hypothetical protein CHCC20375_3890 [Bacillus licheniformis]MEC0554125.1 hypothetical protein [Bacillus haynesii]MEC0674646.1 hypothetical protein [Bacillus haynesii]MEC1455855.1 hypothetical protein [Bacillus haynesii]MEC1552958.1 hypothetical protein [Bacillus haynesii]
MKGNLTLQQDGLRFDQWMIYDENIVHKQSIQQTVLNKAVHTENR